MPIPKSILERIVTVERNLESYLNPNHKEAQVRQEFIDPLFAAGLGCQQRRRLRT